MNDFTFQSPTAFVFGRGVVDRTGTELAARGVKSVLVVYGGGSVVRTGTLERVMTSLDNAGIAHIELGGVRPNPEIASVRAGIELVRAAESIDMVLPVGGGSVIDCAKAIALGACYDGDPWDFFSKRATPAQALPVGVVLTIPASGSEASDSCVISNDEAGLKCGLNCALNRPALAIMDPELTFSVPKNQTAAGAADMMSHIFEQYFASETNLISDGICETILRTVIACAPRAIADPNDYEARSQLMWASSLACNGWCSLGNGIMPWPCHAMEHEVSAYYDITHGVGLAILTPHLMRYSLNEQTVERFCHYGKAVFGMSDESDRMAMANKAIDKTEEFFTSIGLPNNLTALGIDDKNIDAMAEHAVAHNPVLGQCMRPLSLEDVKQIFRNSL